MNSEKVDALDNFVLDSTECRNSRPKRQDGGCETKSELFWGIGKVGGEVWRPNGNRTQRGEVGREVTNNLDIYNVV